MEQRIIEEGTNVVFEDHEAHQRLPEYFPAPGTIGEVISTDMGALRIQWPPGSTSYPDTWYAKYSMVSIYYGTIMTVSSKEIIDIIGV